MASGAAQPGVPIGSPVPASGPGVVVECLMEIAVLWLLLECTEEVFPPLPNIEKVEPLPVLGVVDVDEVEDRLGNFLSKELSPKSVIFALKSSSKRTLRDYNNEAITTNK
jgi:hypothetical protein